MKVTQVLDYGEKDKVLCFDLNWFDLNEKTQNDILKKAKQLVGPDNIFSFPTMHVELFVKEEKI